MAKKGASEPAPKIRHGAIAMVDALGFKGIWGRDAAKLDVGALNTLSALEATANAATAELSKLAEETTKLDGIKSIAKEPLVDVRFLSDSIIVAASVQERTRKPWAAHELAETEKTGLKLDLRLDMLVGFFRSVVCEIVSRLQQAAAVAERPLAYRGVVNTGLFLMHKNFLMGPAVDEAASLMELADASIVWLTPKAAMASARIEPADEARRVAWSRLLVKHRVPLRDGRFIDAKAICPWACADTTGEALVRARVIETMRSAQMDVILKGQNTKAFFAAIDGERALAAFKARTEARKGRLKATS